MGKKLAALGTPLTFPPPPFLRQRTGVWDLFVYFIPQEPVIEDLYLHFIKEHPFDYKCKVPKSKEEYSGSYCYRNGNYCVSFDTYCIEQ